MQVMACSARVLALSPYPDQQASDRVTTRKAVVIKRTLGFGGVTFLPSRPIGTHVAPVPKLIDDQSCHSRL
jgi:hypothetical protein